MLEYIYSSYVIQSHTMVCSNPIKMNIEVESLLISLGYSLIDTKISHKISYFGSVIRFLNHGLKYGNLRCLTRLPVTFQVRHILS